MNGQSDHWTQRRLYLTVAAVIAIIGGIAALFQIFDLSIPLRPAPTPTATVAPTSTPIPTDEPVLTNTPTLVPTVTATPEPDLFIFSRDDNPSTNGYLVRGVRAEDFLEGDELVVFGSGEVGDEEVAIALLRVIGRMPNGDLRTQALLQHETRQIRINMSVEPRTDTLLDDSELIPSSPTAIGYLLREGRVRLRPDANVQAGNVLHVLLPEQTQAGATLDYLRGDIELRVSQVGSSGRVAEVELVDESMSWPPVGTLVGRDEMEVCNDLDPEIELATEGEGLIVVTKFDSTMSEPSDFHDEIVTRIQDIIEQRAFDNVRVELDEVHLFEADERELAEAVGNCYGATVMLWGKEKPFNVDINFLNVIEPEAAAARIDIDERDTVSRLAPPEQYQTFILEDIPRQLTYLSLFAIGQSHYGQENFITAGELIEEAVGQFDDPSSLPEAFALYEAYFRLGFIHYPILQELSKANAYYSDVISLKPDHSGAYLNRGVTFFELQQYNDAVVDYTEAIAIEPDDVSNYNNRGLAYGRLSAYDFALLDFNKAIELDETLADVFNNRGITLYLLDRNEEALDDFNAAIALDPDYLRTFINRGNVYGILGRYAEAIEDYNHVIELQPENVSAIYNRGLAYYRFPE